MGNEVFIVTRAQSKVYKCVKEIVGFNVKNCWVSCSKKGEKWSSGRGMRVMQRVEIGR